MKNIVIALYTLIILNILDALLTGLLVINFGYLVESNSIMQNTMEMLGIKLWIIFKIVVGTCPLLFVIKRIKEKYLTKIFKIIIYTVLILYIIIVVNNFVQVVIFL